MRSLSTLILRIICAAVSYTLAFFFLTAGISSPLHAALTNARLLASRPSPQPLGTTIILIGFATDSDPGPLSYKWEIMSPGSSVFSTLEDFDHKDTFTWSPNYTEGAYRVRMTVRDYLAGTSAQVTGTFNVEPLVTGSQPAVIATANPLVALFSAPTCPVGSTMAVAFQLEGSSQQTVTDSRPCHAGSQNFYIGGMMANQTYTMYSQVTTGGAVTAGPSVSFTTGMLPASLTFPVRNIPVAPAAGADTTSDVLISDYTLSPAFPIATDLNANILWYYPSNLQLTHPVPGGTFLSIGNGPGTGTGTFGTGITSHQLLLEFDLAGNVVRETNSDRVFEQLKTLGMTDPVSRFNHDAIRLANGDTLAVADVQRIFPAGTQGSSEPVDIIGAVIVVLDENFQVLSYWNAFDHDCAGAGCISVNRKGDYKCVNNPKTGAPQTGCPARLLSSPANDWLHLNSIQYLTADGDILISLRDQDWIAKIDFQNGAGTGDILWRLGAYGDFALTGVMGKPYPWFSGQHNPSFIDSAQTTMVVFDNGSTRHIFYGGDSRGQVWSIDQTTMTASLLLNADLGAYAPTLGSAQILLNGDYNFFAGSMSAGAGQGFEVESTELSPTGTVEYQYQATDSSIAYRGLRLPSLYQASLNGAGALE